MQALTAPPRDTLTDAQVLDLLTGDTVQVDAGCELLNPDLSVAEDITADMVAAGGSVSWAAATAPGRTCQLGLSRELQWGTDLVRLRLNLTAGDVTAAFYLGVFCLTTPQKPLGATPVTYGVQQAPDRLYLLLREVGDTYSVPSGAGYLDAVADAVAAAGLTGIRVDGSAADKTLPADMVWPLVPSSGSPTTWLDVVNDLLDAVAYDPLWCDETGAFRSQPHLDAGVRPVEFALSADDPLTSIVGTSRTLTEDQWAAPNRWLFLQSGYSGTPTRGSGLYVVVNQSDGPASIDGRGLVWSRQFTLDAADQATLRALGDAQVAADKAVTAQLTLTTGLLPIAGQDDVLTYTDAAVGGTLRVQATAWTLPLDGSDMTWTVQSVGG